ncbi:MAG: T9SS type A sorting domain-containing protein [Ignavibacteriae bacterium]|nr:T9SS type A sorting domain-containing protein [Ignavibacteriota bacterium]
MHQGQPVRPLPSEVALGLFDSDPLLDLAYYDDGKIQVWRNLGNGTFGTRPIWETTSRPVAQMAWRRAPDAIWPRWSDLVVTYFDNSSERISHEMIRRWSPGFAVQINTPGGPTLKLNEVWRSDTSWGAFSIVADDIDNDGKNEAVYWFYPSPLIGINCRMVVYENQGNDSWRIDWDTIITRSEGPYCLSDVDGDGHTEIIFVRDNKIQLLECVAPGQYKYYSTNISWYNEIGWDVFRILVSDYDHDGHKELVAVVTNHDRGSFVFVCEYVSTMGTQFSFDQRWISVYGWLFSDIEVGQVDGTGDEEIILCNGDFGIGEHVPVAYLTHGPTGWVRREIHTGLSSGCMHALFVDIDGDSTKEIIAGGVGPYGHGSLYAVKWLRDSTFTVVWVDSTLNGTPTGIRAGTVGNGFYAAISNDSSVLSPTWWGLSALKLYSMSGQRVAVWMRDSASIGDFLLRDLDGDGNTNVLCGLNGSPYISRSALVDFEASLITTTQEALPPSRAEFLQNYPNPFNPSTQIKFDLPEASHVTLAVYDVLGRKVVELVNGQVAEGYHTATWNAVDAASGVYFARFTATDAGGNLKLNKVSKLLLNK